MSRSLALSILILGPGCSRCWRRLPATKDIIVFLQRGWGSWGPRRDRRPGHPGGPKPSADSFRARVDSYRQMIEKDDADLRDISQQVRVVLSRDWLLSRLKLVHMQAMGDEPVGIDADGDEIYLPSPNFPAALRALAEMARVLRLSDEPIDEDDELSRALAEIRAERAAKVVN